MPGYRELTVDKFTFKVANDRHYTGEGVWAKPEGTRIRIGLSDFLQQRSGDVAFAEVKPAGTFINVGDEIAVIETIKVNISVASPVRGVVIVVNPSMTITPEAVNHDPYGAGWLAEIEASDWEADLLHLLDPDAYLQLMKGQAEEEAKQR